jgi:hypothetical protein
MDLFAEIGLRKVARTEGLKEIEPLRPPEMRLAPISERAPAADADAAAEPHENFQKGLAALKETYRPYLAEHAPEMPPVFRHDIRDMRFRYETDADRADFDAVLRGEGEWEAVSLPDYRGPENRWAGYYRAVFTLDALPPGGRALLRFNGVDYRCRAYVNGRCVGAHEGFFAPFFFDVTGAARRGENTLLVHMENDIATIGIDNTDLDGDKIYAATGFGWDDPDLGWHHCPAGAGIWGDVWIEFRPEVFVSDIFIFPAPEKELLLFSVTADSSLAENVPISFEVTVCPRNFLGEPTVFSYAPAGRAGHGENLYEFSMPFPGSRLWEPETPWMYTARVALSYGGGTGGAKDTSGASFGVRDMRMVSEGPDRGEYLLNGRKLRLRGANEMGNIANYALHKNADGIFEDLMIAKLCHINFFRFTQRPMDALTYDICDRVGMLNQCDFPLFGYLRHNLYGEGLRQVGEMERLIRNHPSVIAVSYCNERFSAEEKGLAHRHLSKEGFESWFRAADEVVRLYNPGRVVKHVEGDYDPVAESAAPPDFHCYNMWYNNHALPIGKLYKGYLPAIAPGWKIQCGEYGTEGLDNYDLMASRYPARWLALEPSGGWNPSRITKAQTGSMHGDWFEEQFDIQSWIAKSQAHQAMATRLMTDAFRRRSDILINTVVHLLIDAWPGGWSKTLVGVDRAPKPAYYALQKSLTPLRLSLRCDRWTAFGGETLPVEVWLLNDTARREEGLRAALTLRGPDSETSYGLNCQVDGTTSFCAGIAELTLPAVGEKTRFAADAALLRGKDVLYTERLELTAYPPPPMDGEKTAALGGEAVRSLMEAGIPWEPYAPGGAHSSFLVSDPALWARHGREIEARVKGGASAVFMLEGGEGFTVEGVRYSTEPVNGLTFIARDAAHPVTSCFEDDELSFWYDRGEGAIGWVADRRISGGSLAPLAFTYQKPGWFDPASLPKRRLPVLGEAAMGRGRVLFSTIRFPAFCGAVPAAGLLLRNCLRPG